MPALARNRLSPGLCCKDVDGEPINADRRQVTGLETRCLCKAGVVSILRASVERVVVQVDELREERRELMVGGKLLPAGEGFIALQALEAADLVLQIGYIVPRYA